MRFSKPKQAQGDSFRRQFELALEYAREHRWVIDETLNDEGVSAFSGQNVKDGAVGTFRRYIQQGKIKPGTVLLVESLDRLSRNTITEQMGLLLRILGRGVETANVEAMTAGRPLPYVTAYGFFTAFVNVGGTGAAFALALVMLNSKEPGYRKVSRRSRSTQIFQINKPIFFDFPIVLNPIFMVPYILNALILTTTAFLLMPWGLIHKPFVNVPWTTPPIIGHHQDRFS